MDEADRRILRELQKDPSLTLRDLAERVGLSHAPCGRRLQRLRETGAISDRRHIVNPEAAGFDASVFCLIRMKEHDRVKMEAFEEAVLRLPQIVQCHIIAGEHDYLLRVLARSMRDYEETVKYAIMSLPNIGAISTIVALRDVKISVEVPL